jgi:hypothetical protein
MNVRELNDLLRSAKETDIVVFVDRRADGAIVKTGVQNYEYQHGFFVLVGVD